MDNFATKLIYFHSPNEIMEDQLIRQSRNALKVFRQIEQEENSPFVKEKSKQIGPLQSIKRQIHLENLRSTFIDKISKNNIFQQPKFQQFLNPKQKDLKSFVSWKGYHLKYEKYILSIFYMTEMIFLLFTYVLSSLMSCIPRFVETQEQTSPIALSVIFVSMVLCFTKMVFFSVLKKVHKGIILEYISDIFLAYVKTWIFYLDLVYLIISCSLLAEMVRAYDVKRIEHLSSYLFVCTILRIFGSTDNLIAFRNAFITGMKMDQFYKLLKLTVFNWILGHFVAVMLLAMVYINDTENWLVSKNIYHEPWYVQYNWAFYWAATIMTTVGFGDYSATTHQQAHVVAYLQLFSCIVLAYNISEIGNIIYAMRLADQQYLGKVAAFKRLGEQNHTNPQLRMKIQSYLRQEKQIKEMFDYHQQVQVISSLPQSLKKDFILESTNRIFRSLPFFRSLHKYASIELGEALISKIEYPGEILVRANHYNENIIILRQGKVGLVYNKLRSMLNGIIVQEISQKKNDSILSFKKSLNIVPFLLTVQFLSPGKVINCDITVMEYSFVSKIKIDKLIEIIKSNQIDLEYFFSTVHSHHAHEREWFQLQCQRCSIVLNEKHILKESLAKGTSKRLQKESQHNKFNCPKLHYFPWKKAILLKFIKKPGLTQEGSKIYKRKKSKSESCLILRKRIFNKYELKRFINQKKRYQMIVKKAQFQNSSKLKSLKSRRLSGFGMSRKNTLEPFRDPFLQAKIMSTKQIDQKYNHRADSDLRFSDPFIEQQQFEIFQEVYEDEEMKTMIEDVIKTTVHEITPKNITLNFWNLQIDIMFNYRNYFPQSNAALLDNFSLCGFETLQKKRALTFLGEILKNVKTKTQNPFQTNQNSDLLGLQNFKLLKKVSFEPPKSNTTQVQSKTSFYGQHNVQNGNHFNEKNSNTSNIRFEVNFDNFFVNNFQAQAEQSHFTTDKLRQA